MARHRPRAHGPVGPNLLNELPEQLLLAGLRQPFPLIDPGQGLTQAFLDRRTVSHSAEGSSYNPGTLPLSDPPSKCAVTLKEKAWPF